MDELHENLQQLNLLRSNFDLQAPPPRRSGPRPLVPPKPKKGAQPLVPQSCDVSGVCKPSYAALIAPPTNDSAHFYQNYSNSPSLVMEEELLYSNLPPPPPLDHFKMSDHCEDEFPPPPSPVSSSYSELRRTVQPPMHHHFQMMHNKQVYANDYGIYGPGSQTSTTYESIYEPINPRPPSEMSSRSAYSLYSGQDGRQVASQPAESEVDALTDLLVASMQPEKGGDDHYGICAKCGQKVLGETSGCTAMQQIYHVTCFTCHHCQINLQGKPFYALDGRPYCEPDYLGTLEKCSVCLRAILERILRATGKPYHPQCFCCIVCGKSLDGIPFTVDATNQIHCIEDFHKKFAPRCCVCQQPIMPEPGEDETVRVVALDRSFHIACYKCEDCALPLSSEAEGRGCYPLDDHVLCKSCNAKRVQALTSHMTTEL